MYIEHIPSLAHKPAPPMVEPALESLLSRSMLHVDIVAELSYCGSWFIDEPRYAYGLFHLVGEGDCQVESPVLPEALQLHVGDLVVFPHGDPHRLSTSPDATCASTSLICGELHFSSNAVHPLSLALPACFVVRAAYADNVFRNLSALMVDVANSGVTGRQVLLNKLADTLFTLAICDFAQRQTDHRGLFAALADTRICKVLRAVHEHPGHAWTMQYMASLACMSRSAFAERFAQLMKVPPMQYVTQWRVSVAERLLRDRQMSVASIAEQLGYRSEAAFRRLFKRVSGVCPGHIRSRDHDYAVN